MKYLRNILFTLLLATLSCNNQTAVKTGAEEYYQPQYANGFYIEKQGNEKLLHILNPWQGAEDVKFTYRLCSHDDTAALAASFNNIPVPVKRAVCLSTTHIAYIDLLKETETIVGISGVGYVSNPDIRDGVKSGKVHDIGYETGVYYEKLAALQPDVVFAYGVTGEISSVADKLNSLGIRVVFIGDYLENSPLGKAEYLMAFAAFYEKEDLAITEFNAIVDDYVHVKDMADTVKYRPKILLNAPWRSAWYFPGTDNYLTVLIHDAGGEALGCWPGRESAPLSLELAYSYALQADYWLHPNTISTLDELKRNDIRFATVPAFRQHRVFNNSLRNTPEGGSDFWESGVVRPNIILRDLIRIMHPDLLPEHQLVYYKQLQ
jgi:iron complex transport system substrate-binding protein